ncbi:MAG: oligosaccharide flippase family protein [Coriobacteriia bacterium]|nr:oligosaccharide flippase family protein [Coriobacteriia bacterium]
MRGKKAGVVFGYVSLLLQQSVSFFLTPFMLAILGGSQFGVYRLMLSMGPFFALADLGLSNTVVRYLSEYRAKSDRQSERRFVALVLITDLLAGLLIVLAGAILWRIIPDAFSESLVGSELQLLQKLSIFLVANAVLNLFVNLTTGVMKSYKEFGLLRGFEIVRVIIRTTLVVVLLLTGYGVLTVVLVDTIMTAATLIITAAYSARKLGVRPEFKTVTLAFAKGILAYSAVVFVDVLAFQLFSSADAVVIGIEMSSRAVAVYSVGVQISALFFALSSIISDVLMPEVVERVVKDADAAELTDYMARVGRMKLLILALPTIGFAFLGRSFIALWVGKGFLDAFSVALIVIIPSMLSGLSDAGLYVMWAKNKARVKAFASLITALVNVVITIVLVRVVGIIGAAIGTSIAWVGYTLFNGFYLQASLRLDMSRFYIETFRRIWATLVGGIAFAALIATIHASSWYVLIAQIVAVSLFYLWLAWAVSMEQDEKSIIKDLLRLR